MQEHCCDRLRSQLSLESQVARRVPGDPVNTGALVQRPTSGACTAAQAAAGEAADHNEEGAGAANAGAGAGPAWQLKRASEYGETRLGAEPRPAPPRPAYFAVRLALGS